jgi:hypothetical protein
MNKNMAQKVSMNFLVFLSQCAVLNLPIVDWCGIGGDIAIARVGIISVPRI